MNFKQLKELYLNSNNISDIKVLETIKFEKLEKLDLKGNEIDIEKFSLIINSFKLNIKNFNI